MPTLSNGVMLTPKAAQATAKVVREALRSIPRSSATPNTPTDKPPFYAMLQEEDSSNAGFYAWKMYNLVNGRPIISSPLVEDTDYSASELNLGSGLSGTIVLMYWAGYDFDEGDQPPRYIFEVSSANAKGEFQGMINNINVTQNQTGSSYAFFHELI